ncbi:MAG: hypothetical protein NTZ42_02890 [Candidatus Gribaldobacteria bacterium]|nr:hypothetical protein [Candidatus Gribaldobacteria bacterium]
MIKKIIGWLLLAIGVLAIVWGTWQSYQIFTNQAPSPAIFKMGAEQGIILPQKAAQTQDELIGQQLQQLLQEQLGKMIPVDTIAKLLNLTVWSLFVGILVLASSKIATIGIQLLNTKTDKAV